MLGRTTRFAVAFVTAGGIALALAANASAATFKDSSGQLTAKVKGVSISGGTLSFTGKADPTGTAKFAGQINITNGQATGLKASGKLTLKHSGTKATLKISSISGSTLTATLNAKKLKFPISLTSVVVTPGLGNVSVSVTGVTVKLSKADASALNKALKTKSFKKTLGTLAYSGTDRELIQQSGNDTLCNDKAFILQTLGNSITPSADAPATGGADTNCSDATENGTSLSFPLSTTPLGFIDTASQTGRLSLEGGIRDARSGGSTGDFTSPTLYLQGTNFNNSSLSATVVVDSTVNLGVQSVATVAFTAMPTLTITATGATLTIAHHGTTVALTDMAAGDLNTAFCTPTTSCPAGAYTAGENIGYSYGSVTFK